MDQEVFKYELLVREQLRDKPLVDMTKSNAAATEARFMSEDTKFATWVQFASQGDAAEAAYGSRDQKFRARVNSSVYAGDIHRKKQKNKWVFRNSLRRDANKRGWHSVRRLVRVQPVLRELLKDTYKPGGQAQLRAAKEVQKLFDSSVTEE